MCTLRELYGPGVERLRIERQQFETPSKKIIEMTTLASNYHIEVNASDAGIYDRVVIQEMIKTIAQTNQLDASTQKSFKGNIYLFLYSLYSSFGFYQIEFIIIESCPIN